MKSSLKIGRFAEAYVEKLLKDAGFPALANKKKRRDELAQWDIESDLDGQTFRLEVKFDVMARTTGNVAIEYYNTKSCCASGLSATTADLWVYVFEPLSAFVCRTSDLIQFTKQVSPSRQLSSAGDDNAAIFLYAKSEILPAVFHQMDGLAPDDFRSLITTLLKDQ